MDLYRRLSIPLVIGTLAAFAGCAEPVDDVDRTQPNALDKSLFQGEWYFARTVIDAPYETSGTFVGDRQEGMFKEDYPAYRVRWRLEEDRLMACRVDEVIVGSDSQAEGEIDRSKLDARDANDATGEDWEKFPCEHPIASFKILGHFDKIRQYNTSTGEQSNVIVENNSDRHWHERQYIRVDWTDLGVTDLNFSLLAQQDFGWLKMDSPYYVQEESNDCRTMVDGKTDYSGCQEGFLPPMIEADSINITNRVTMSPGDGAFECYITEYYGGTTPCTLNEIGIRYSFLKVPERSPEEQYEKAYYPEDKFERFGVWRTRKNTYLPGRGETDFQEVWGTRFHIWNETHSCDGDGENCTPLPLAERTLKGIPYYLNSEFPPDLKPAAFRVAKEWNDAFNGVVPGLDLTTSCKVTCAGGKPGDQCAATDDDWKMEGTCAFRLHENTGKEFLGDLRYSFIAFIEDASTGQPCGVGGPANDPETGELINATSYVYGAGCFDFLEERVTDMVDLLCAQKEAEGVTELPVACRGIDENQFLRGLRALEIMQAQGYTQGPRRPIRPLTGAGYDFGSDEMALKLQDVRIKMDNLQRNKGALARRVDLARAHGLDKALITDELAREVSGGLAHTASDLTDEQIKMANPFNPADTHRGGMRQHIDKLAAHAVEPAEYLFTDAALWSFASSHMNLSRDEFKHMIREQAFRATTLHELGHNMGLRHNFIASFDRMNYFPQYWDIRAQTEADFEEEFGRPAPTFDPFIDSDETPEEFNERYQRWDADRTVLAKMQDDAGIRQYRYSSIMDYSGLYYNDWEGLGSYDKAAMRFLYADLVDRIDCQGRTPEACAKSSRQHVKWYVGGELCDANADCPSSAEGQKCQRDDRRDGNVGAKFCSNWDDDEKASGRFNPRQAFCSDDRVGDNPFCNRFDEGESSEEIVRNMIGVYERNFIFNNFRRYRAGFSIRSYYSRIFSRYFSVIGDQMQSLLYKYFYEPGFRSNQAQGGFYDMFRATVVGYDFLGNVLSRPEPGSYRLNTQTGRYEQLDAELVENPSDEVVNIPLGMGKTLFSSYEEGYFGETSRLGYVGTFYDKLAALETLTLRDWGATALSNEQRFQLNFFDFFPGAQIDLLGALMDGEGLTNHYDPATEQLHQATYWDGSFFDDEDTWDPREISAAVGTPISGGATIQLDQAALIYSMLYIPYFADLSFTNSMRLFEVGGQTGFDLANIDPDAILTCSSPLTHRRFAAVRTENVKSIAWMAIQKCKDLASSYLQFSTALDTGILPEGMTRSQVVNEHRRLERELETQEDRLANQVYISELLGIGSL